MIQVVSSYAELCALTEEWTELWNRSPAMTPFQSPEWLLPWWRHLFRGGEMWTIAVREQGRLAGLAPMFIYGEKCVAFIGSGVSDYLGFIAEDANSARQIWSAIASAGDRWSTCDFQDIPPDSPMLLPFEENVSVRRQDSAVCPVLALPATTGELEACLSAKFRHNLRNSRNRLSDLGASFEVGAPHQDGEYIEALFRLHSERWATKAETGVLHSLTMQAFLREACCGFRCRGWLRWYGLRLRGDLKAVVCIFCAHLRSAYYIGGFDPELSRYSPGSALILFATENATAEGCAEFDFLRQGESYKYEWGARDRVNSRLLVRHSETSAADR